MFFSFVSFITSCGFFLTCLENIVDDDVFWRHDYFKDDVGIFFLKNSSFQSLGPRGQLIGHTIKSNCKKIPNVNPKIFSILFLGKRSGTSFSTTLYVRHFKEKIFQFFFINWPSFIVWPSLLLDILWNMCIAINQFLVADVINFELPVFLQDKKNQDKNLNILRTKELLTFSSTGKIERFNC